MSDLTLPDDLKQWQDALDDRDLAKQAYDSFKGSLQAKALLAEVLIQAMQRLQKLRIEHQSATTEPAETSSTAASNRELAEIGSLEESESPDLVTGTFYSEDEYHDNRERMRNIR